MRKRFFAALKMTRWALRMTILAVAIMIGSQQRASAQFATFDASNLAQAVLSFLQDGDNMVLNTEQFLQNLGVAKEQLEFLQEMDKRYREVRSDLYKAQSVVRMAQNYEQMARMFTRYVERVKAMNGNQINYYQGRSMVNEGFQYLLYASREVKRAREYLDKRSQVSEEERLKALAECDRQVSRANAAMYYHIKESYEEMDAAIAVAEGFASMEEAFQYKY